MQQILIIAKEQFNHIEISTALRSTHVLRRVWRHHRGNQNL